MGSWLAPWKGWAERSQTHAQGNAQQAAIALAQQRRAREDAERFVAQHAASLRERRSSH